MSRFILTDRVLAIAAIVGAAMAVEYGWSHYPRPVEGGGLILGMVAALASVRFLRNGNARPLFGRVAPVIISVLIAQVLLQTGASLGWF